MTNSRSRGSAPLNPSSPLNLDEAFDLGHENIERCELLPTGLNDEEDAARFLAQQFDPDLRQCAKGCDRWFRATNNNVFCPDCMRQVRARLTRWQVSGWTAEEN